MDRNSTYQSNAKKELAGSYNTTNDAEKSAHINTHRDNQTKENEQQPMYVLTSASSQPSFEEEPTKKDHCNPQ